ncbi:MAG: 2,5-diamino-6-(ribosylamino)-4(3H)-pyrimidinone 5'-phosphate reductase [Candidatus Thermoplasmatota archaeon]
MKTIINCAMSADGKIALRSRRQTTISDDEDKRRVHKLRNSVDAILVGVDTVISDDPKLTVNEKYVRGPKHPVRVVLDSDGRTPAGALVLNGASRTIIVTNEHATATFPNAEVVRCGKDEVDLVRLMPLLEAQGIHKLLVEGGSKVIWSFLRTRLADEVYIFIGSMVIGGDASPTPAGGQGAADEKDIVQLRLKGAEVLGSGVLVRYEVVK